MYRQHRIAAAALVATALIVASGLGIADAAQLSIADAAQQGLQVVATLPAYEAIARHLLADDAEIGSIASAHQDAHFVQPKPSYSIRIGRADLLIATGLDLELWLAPVVDKSRNRRVRSGEPGFVAVATGVPMLDVPDNPSRAGGDIHIYGNPHVHADPLRSVMLADNIRVGLQRVDSGNAGLYQQRFDAYKELVYRRLFGAELVGLVGGDKLARLEMAHRLLPFLESTSLGGAPLVDRLGGWMAEASCLRGKRLVAYHPNWVYLMDRFGIDIAAYVERRPGIPPSAAHVAELVDLIRREKIRVLWVADYFGRRVPELIGERTGAIPLTVPLYPDPGATDGPRDILDLYDEWIGALRGAFPDCAG